MPRPALLLAAAVVTLGATGCAQTARVVRRPATAGERNAVVECAAAVALDEGFVVTQRRPDVGLLSATRTAEERAPAGPLAPKGGGDLGPELGGGPGEESEVLTVSIARDPVNQGLALLVRAAAQVGDSTVSPSPRTAMARDRIIRSCAYLVG